MAKLVKNPAVIETSGTPVEEIVGRVNTNTAQVSIARMHSHRGWVDDGQIRQFAECVLVFTGALHVRTPHQRLVARAGQAVLVPRGEWVQYSTPERGGARYLAVCVPAFRPRAVRKAIGGIASQRQRNGARKGLRTRQG